MKKFKKILIGIVILIAAVAVTGFYYYNKPHESIAHEKPIAFFNAEKLLDEYNADEKKSDSLYLGKVIEVSGMVEENTVDGKGIASIILTGNGMSGINCQFAKDQNQKISSVKTGSSIQLKGICTGILTDVVLVDCVLLK